MKQTFMTLALAMCFGFAGSAGAALSKDEVKAEKDRIEADYKAAREKCNALSGNAQDICKAEAKGRHDVAKAELVAQEDPSPRNEAKLKTEKAEAEYKVAKQKCEDMSGNPKDVCKKDAKAAYEVAKADAKAVRTSQEKGPASTRAAGAARDSRDDKMDAQYTAARERCDSLAGQAKDDCVNDAKRKFGKM
jgi:hypothetical protein